MRHVEAYSRLAGVYDEIVVDPCHGQWASFLDELWSADPGGVRAVLDLCCGTGLLAGELIARGYRVVGVDASEAMLALARERLGREVVLSRMTLPDLAVDGGFDAAVCTFDGLNYLTPKELRLTIDAVAGCLRPGGWLVFDLHTDAMMNFTIANPTVAGRSAGNDFVISSVVDPGTRTCDTRIEMTRPRDGDPFSEQHRQYFHADADVRVCLEDAGFAVIAVEEEYTHESVDASTLRATWTARLRSRDSSGPEGRDLSAPPLSFALQLPSARPSTAARIGAPAIPSMPWPR